MAVRVVLAVLFLVFATSECGPVPLVMWHGMGDTCCNPLSLGRIQKQIEQEVPGIYVKSLQIGNSVIEDELNGFFMNSNKQIDMVCSDLSTDQKLSQGFNVMGFSQGGQFLRALVQRCDKVKVRNLLSVGGQHQGVFGFPRCPGDNSSICETVRKLLNLGAYDSFVQEHLVQAEYWQDPMNEDEYREKCIFLPDINQEKTFNAAYKTRLSNITNLVLVMFTEDTMVQPKESEWFGFYKEGQDVNTYTLYDSNIWKQDLLGLQHLNSTGRLHFLAAPFDHLQFTMDWFNQNLLPYIKVDFADVHKPIHV